MIPAPADTAGRLFVALARVNRMLRREVPAGLSHGAVTALATIARDGPLRLGDLALREGASAPAMTRIVAGLEAEGYVTRTTDPADGRAWLIQVTDDGAQWISGASSARAQVLRERVACLSAGQRAAIEAALPALELLAVEEPVQPTGRHRRGHREQEATRVRGAAS